MIENKITIKYLLMSKNSNGRNYDLEDVNNQLQDLIKNKKAFVVQDNNLANLALSNKIGVINDSKLEKDGINITFSVLDAHKDKMLRLLELFSDENISIGANPVFVDKIKNGKVKDHKLLYFSLDSISSNPKD